MTYDEWRVVSLAPLGRLGQVAALLCACIIVFFAWRALRHDERWSRRWILLALWLGANSAPGASVVTDLTRVSADTPYYGYGAGDINSCAIDHNNLISDGTYQYIAYYGPITSIGGQNKCSIYLSRRTLGAATWSTPLDTGISIFATSTNNEIADDHNIIAIGIDSTGHMHMSWDMHNTSLKYAISNGVVNGPEERVHLIFDVPFNPILKAQVEKATLRIGERNPEHLARIDGLINDSRDKLLKDPAPPNTPRDEIV